MVVEVFLDVDEGVGGGGEEGAEVGGVGGFGAPGMSLGLRREGRPAMLMVRRGRRPVVNRVWEREDAAAGRRWEGRMVVVVDGGSARYRAGRGCSSGMIYPLWLRSQASKCHSVHFVVYSAGVYARRAAFVLPHPGPSPAPRRRAAHAMSPGPETAGSWEQSGETPVGMALRHGGRLTATSLVNCRPQSSPFHHLILHVIHVCNVW